MEAAAENRLQSVLQLDLATGPMGLVDNSAEMRRRQGLRKVEVALMEGRNSMGEREERVNHMSSFEVSDC